MRSDGMLAGVCTEQILAHAYSELGDQSPRAARAIIEKHDSQLA